jgi:hypothetical protein
MQRTRVKTEYCGTEHTFQSCLSSSTVVVCGLVSVSSRFVSTIDTRQDQFGSLNCEERVCKIRVGFSKFKDIFPLVFQRRLLYYTVC